MAKYIKVKRASDGAKRITEVNDITFITYLIDGNDTVTGYTKTRLDYMGYGSLDEYLEKSEHGGDFVKVEG